MLRMVLCRSAAVVAVGLVAACGPATPHTADRSAGEPATAPATGSATATKSPTLAVPATGGAGYSATLSARLLSPDSVPPGFTVEIATVMAPDAGAERPGADVPCASMIPLLSGTRLTGTPSAMAAATLGFDAGPDGYWVANEVLRTYADDGARRALADLRTFIGRCPTATSRFGDNYRYAVVPGPRLGDESVRVSCSTTSGALGCDTVLVRIGTTLVVVQEQGNEPGGSKYLTQVAEAALRRYEATGS